MRKPKRFGYKNDRKMSPFSLTKLMILDDLRNLSWWQQLFDDWSVSGFRSKKVGEPKTIWRSGKRVKRFYPAIIFFYRKKCNFSSFVFQLASFLPTRIGNKVSENWEFCWKEQRQVFLRGSLLHLSVGWRHLNLMCGVK